MEAISLIAWDCAFFGKKIARLEIETALPDAEAIESYCRTQHIELLQACVDTGDSATIFALETRGFHFVDLRLDMAARVSGSPRKDAHIQRSAESDIPALLSVSHHSFFEVSRYNWLGFFAPAQIDAFYDTWLENGVRGTHDDCCFHYVLDGKIAGFTTVKLHDNEASIGLIAVDAKLRGNGIGDALVENVFAYAKERGLATVSSVTQGRNRPAQTLYGRHGMQVRSTQSWYYKKI